MMHKESFKLWVDYCKAINVNPDDKFIMNDNYYQQGFIVWQQYRKDYHYHNYMRLCIKG